MEGITEREAKGKFELDYQLWPFGTCLDIAAHGYMKHAMEIPDIHTADKRILDIGGGPKSLLMGTFGYGTSTIIDPVDYPAHIEGLGNLLASKKITFRNCTAEDIVDEYDNYDEVWCYNTIPHTDTPEKFLLSLVRKLKDGGIIRIMEPMHKPYLNHPTEVTKELFDIIRTNASEIIKEEVVNYHSEGYFTNDHLVLIAKMKKVERKLKIHIYSLPHMPVIHDDPKTVCCAYTTKIWLLCKKLMEEGHEVIHYGVEGSHIPCTENIEYIPRSLWEKCYGSKSEKSFYIHDSKNEVYLYAAKHLPEEINSRIVDPKNEIVLASFGGWSEELYKINKAALVEFGVGYEVPFTYYRAFESYAWQHSIYGKRNELVSFKGWHDAVIPGYVDPTEFDYSDQKENYLLFVGRIMDTKGVMVAAQLAKHYGLKLKIAGNGNVDWIHPEYTDTIEYLGVVGVEEKRKLYAKAKATLCMTHYVEPFGNVHIESLISGTPVIGTDWGVYSETLPHGEVGFRVRTWEDYRYAIEHLHEISPKKCREWAMATWTLDGVYPKFNAYFKKCVEHFNTQTWYYNQKEREDSISSYAGNYAKYTKVHVAMLLTDSHADRGIRCLRSFAEHHDNYDVTIIDYNLSDVNKMRLGKLHNFKRFVKADTRHHPVWAKVVTSKDIVSSGKLFIIDADMYFTQNVDDFLFFSGNEYIHGVDDFATPLQQDTFNKKHGVQETYFQKAFVGMFPNLHDFDNCVTVNGGLFAYDLNNPKAMSYLEELSKNATLLSREVSAWPYEQGLINYMLFSKEMIGKDFKMFGGNYNSSPYNKAFLSRVDPNLKVIHYHTEDSWRRFAEVYALNP